MPQTNGLTQTEPEIHYLKYVGTDPNHAIGVVAAGNDPDHPDAGASRQVVTGQPGLVVSLEPRVAAAVLEAEPDLWQVVEGFGG